MKKEEYKDQGLRQALQRRNEAAERMTLPEDFTDRLMEQIGKPTPALPKGGCLDYYLQQSRYQLSPRYSAKERLHNGQGCHD